MTTLPSKMKAARFYEVNEPLRVEEVPVPEVQEDEVLVQTRAVGLCGSDIHIVFEGVTPTAFTPITLGHEPSGEVAQKGTRVEGWDEGDRVTVDPVLFCGSCRNCITGHTEICLTRRLIGIQAEGALAEYVVVPAKNLVRLPENVPFTVGAIITDAIATPFHALVDRAVLKVGESVAIYGVGGLGLHAVQIARLLGAAKIFVVDPRDRLLRQGPLGGAAGDAGLLLQGDRDALHAVEMPVQYAAHGAVGAGYGPQHTPFLGERGAAPPRAHGTGDRNRQHARES